MSVPPGPIQWLTADVSVDGDDVSNVALSPQPPITIAGRLAFEGARPAPELGAIHLPLPFAGQTIGTYQASLPQIRLEPGGRFAISGILPGVYRLGALQTQPVQGIRAPIGGWWLKSIIVNGRDLLDAPLDIRQGTDDAVATRNLPPGEYRVVATADLETNEWFAPPVLERLAAAATPITITGVEKKTVDLIVR